MVLHLAASGADPIPLSAGTQLRWIDATQFLYLSGERGAWTLRQGEIGAGSISLASPAGDFVDYHFAP